MREVAWGAGGAWETSNTRGRMRAESAGPEAQATARWPEARLARRKLLAPASPGGSVSARRPQPGGPTGWLPD